MNKRIVVKIKPEIIRHCELQLQKNGLGNRKKYNGTYDEQVTGAIGQSVVMDMFGLGYIDCSTGFDNGVDLEYGGKTYDVKTMGRTVDVRDNYVNNFLKVQDKFDVYGYIFCSRNIKKEELTICGWISKDDFIAKRSFYKEGEIRTRDNGTTFPMKADSYEIRNTDLVAPCDLVTLKIQLAGKNRRI